MPEQTRTALTSFDIHDADWRRRLDDTQNSQMSLSGRATEYISKIRRATLLAEPPESLSLFGLAFDPGAYIPTHYHDVDQFLLVINGELGFGNRRLRPGHGAFMPAGNAYNVKFGRAGGSFLEFRDVATFRTAFNGEDAHLAGYSVPREIAGWSKPAKKTGKTVFFDAETCVNESCSGFGPGDQNGNAPPAIVESMRYQRLHLPEAGYSMVGVSAPNAVVIPPHRQDVDKIVYVLSGELKIDDSKTHRAGSGVFVPASTPVQWASGTAGVRYVEFRKQPTWKTEWL